jgi:D-glycerate 3-kinase
MVSVRLDMVGPFRWAGGECLMFRMDENYRVLAGVLAERILAAAPRPSVVAIAGGQGTGKSTLARSLRDALRAAAPSLRGEVLALDDFYLPRAARQALAATVHPLLVTRGVPGTHDVARLLATLDAAFRPGHVRVPVFDKGLDDRRGERAFEGPVDWLIVEGWCLCARPEPEASLETPVNALEREQDADGRWRRWVDARLADEYARLDARFDFRIYLEAADMASVLRWRTQQEQAVPPRLRMDAARLARFVAHYERITRALARDLPSRADVVVRLAADRSYSVQGPSSTVRP